ncbi:YbaB/EbfC family nucleoid-associated protein [Streptomyces sp. NBC_01476]|uniref:YbaB/EbfC family nucleoid-associated protein n=1 Tax=Streptomyces sp. NBC_01476 TaxID=2903881 RepID=UPI002E3765DA|nr:YbaB/EbfC family nucleoid-associated protein [Streptomyces sp. NBC_01476]
MAGYDQEIEELMAEYRRQREKADTTRRRINESAGTATAPRKTVKVTVTARGEVTDIEFPTAAFRRMTPKELADVLKVTIAEARANALAKVDEHVTFSRLLKGLQPSALLTGSVELADLFPPEPEGGEFPETGQAAPGSRDEP